MPSTADRFLITIASSVIALSMIAGGAAAQAPPAAPSPSARPAAPTLPGEPEGTQRSEEEPTAEAGNKDMQRVAACKDRALARLKEKSPSVDDIFIDVDGLTVADADSKIGGTVVRGVLMGEAYIRRDRSDRVNRFLCLTGADGEVLFTFFTER